MTIDDALDFLDKHPELMDEALKILKEMTAEEKPVAV